MRSSLARSGGRRGAVWALCVVRRWSLGAVLRNVLPQASRYPLPAHISFVPASFVPASFVPASFVPASFVPASFVPASFV